MSEEIRPYRTGPLKTEEPCIRCGKPTRLTFACPCDLFHPLCAACGRKVERLDCAHITGPRIIPRCGEGSCLRPDHLAIEEDD